MKITDKKFIITSSITSIVLLLVIPIASTDFFAFAQEVKQTEGFTVITGDQLKNNPMALDILQKIELSKKRIAQYDDRQKQIEEQKKFIDQQRKLAKESLEKELNQMNDDYQDFTPRASFAKFVSKTPSKTHDVFWGMFDYQRMKVKAAQNAMKDVLDNGGSMQEAREAYYQAAATKRVQLIEVTQELNIQFGLTDSAIQNTFDKYGKLPRTEA